MKKPEKIPLIKFCLGPLIDLWYETLEGLGWWNCSYCDKLHSPRVKRYTRANYEELVTIREFICSLGVDDDDKN